MTLVYEPLVLRRWVSRRNGRDASLDCRDWCADGNGLKVDSFGDARAGSQDPKIDSVMLQVRRGSSRIRNRCISLPVHGYVAAVHFEFHQLFRRHGIVQTMCSRWTLSQELRSKWRGAVDDVTCGSAADDEDDALYLAEWLRCVDEMRSSHVDSRSISCSEVTQGGGKRFKPVMYGTSLYGTL